jgi:hypothetical protein
MPINAPPREPSQLPAEIAVFPLSGCILLPRAELPLNIFEPRYLAMVDDALKGDRIIGMIQPDVEKPRVAGEPSLYGVGCAGRITQFGETGDGRYLMTLTGLSRFRVAGETASTTPYRRCAVDFAPYAADLAPADCCETRRAEVIAALRRFAGGRGFKVDWAGVDETPNETLINALAMMAPFGVAEKQALIEAQTLEARAEALVSLSAFALAERVAGAPARRSGVQ